MLFAIRLISCSRHIGHLAAVGDHFQTSELTSIDDHERSSSCRTLSINFFVQVLQIKSNFIKIFFLLSYSGVNPQTAG